MAQDMSQRTQENISEASSEIKSKKCQKEFQKIASSQSAKLRATERISGNELHVYPDQTASG